MSELEPSYCVADERIKTGPLIFSEAPLALPAPVARTWADRVGIFLSLLCVVHCLLTPVILLSVPALQALAIVKFHESFHIGLLLILPFVALLAFIPGYRRHRNWRVFAWAAPGFLLIAAVALVFDETSWSTTLVSVTGSLLLIRSHMINRKLCACCELGGESALHVKTPSSNRLLTPPRAR